MRQSDCETDLLRRLAGMPLMDRLEMVALTGWSRGSVYEIIGRLEEGGLIARVPHATDLVPLTARFIITASGLGRLADQEGSSEEEVLRSLPVSAHWRRLLLERLDALSSIYRLASAVSNVSYDLRMHWYRAAPMDVSFELPDGRTVAVVRQGLTSDRTSFAKRMWRMWDGPLPSLVLVMVPDRVRLRIARTLLSGAPVPALAALEEEIVPAGQTDPVWHAPTGGVAISLASALARASREGALQEEPDVVRAWAPQEIGSVAPGLDLPDHMMPSVLRAAEKRALDLLFDWPYVSRAELADLLSVSASRASRLLGSLRDFGLVTRIGDEDRRIALTDQGLAFLARRDRTSLGVIKRRWSASPVDPDAQMEWRNVSGSRSRQLLRNLEHTTAVNGFAAAIARQARTTGWDVVQLDPPMRASRYFRLGGTLRAVNPDAFGILRRESTVWPFFLEWERRAVRPATMAGRIAPYIRYYSTKRPIDDHGVEPSVLVVFHDDLAATGFLRVARREMVRARVSVPLLVSDRATVERLGPLGPAWRRAGEWTHGHALPAA